MGLFTTKQYIPLRKMIEVCWPDVRLYDKQWELIESFERNDITISPAGNMLGKDFVSALINLSFFLSRVPCRCVTTSVDQSQLNNVLWGEIRNFINTSSVALPLKTTEDPSSGIKRVLPDGTIDAKSYLIGRVAKAEEGLLGHHLARGPHGEPHTAMTFDESSGIPDGYEEKTSTWCHRMLIIGNPFPCENFFNRFSEEGDKPREYSGGYYRKVIRIKGTDSPNVRYALAQQRAGVEPTGEILIPGVLSWNDYCLRRSTWDPIRQCVSLDAEFYKGAEILLFPPDWLNAAEESARLLKSTTRQAKTIGVDPAEGGDSTCWSVCDSLGLIRLYSMKTPNTAFIVNQTIALIQEWNVKPENVLFDAGGGGKQIADQLRERGYAVRTIGFGESVVPDPRRGITTIETKKKQREDRYAYVNRRAQMYGQLSAALEPDDDTPVFAIPEQYRELRRQLAPIPRLLDREGRLYLPPKSKKNKESKERTLIEILGCSPDEADSLVLAYHGLCHKVIKNTAGGIRVS